MVSPPFVQRLPAPQAAGPTRLAAHVAERADAHVRGARRAASARAAHSLRRRPPGVPSSHVTSRRSSSGSG